MTPDPEADTRGVEPLTLTELQRERYDVDGCQPHATCTTTFGQRQRVVATIDKLRAKVREQAHNEQVIRVLQQQNVDALARIDAEVAKRQEAERERDEARTALFTCRRAMRSTLGSLTETARREVHMYLSEELCDAPAAAEWHESVIAATALDREGEANANPS